MRTKEEVYNLISDLNDEAHSLAWDTWVKSDNLMNSENEDDWTRAEEVRNKQVKNKHAIFVRCSGAILAF